MSRNDVTARRGVQCAACGASLIDRTGYRGWTMGYRRRRRLDRRYCSNACRQRAYRARKRAGSGGGVAESGAVG